MARNQARVATCVAILAALALAACDTNDGSDQDTLDGTSGDDPGTIDPGTGDPGAGGDRIGSCLSPDGGCIENEFDLAQPAMTWDALEQICTLGSGTWTLAPCPVIDLLGVCTLPKSDGQTVRNYCYDRGVVPPADQIVYCRTPCDDAGGAWNTP